jgi:hypothetical protein
MSVWFFEQDPPHAFSLADETTALAVTLILRGAWEDDLPPAEVIDLAAARARRDAR